MDNVNMNQYPAPADNDCEKTQGAAGLRGGEKQAYARRIMPGEAAEKLMAHHRHEMEKSERASVFFRRHPEFDEFVQLVREGVISF